jgi:pseudomonalisin
MLRSLKAHSLVSALLIFAASAAALSAQKPDRIVRPIDENNVVTLEGNVHPLARGEFDLGAVANDTVLERMVLELEPSKPQQAELDELVCAQHSPGSPLYREWLTPAEYADRFGVSPADVARITGWLRHHGFTVVEVAASRRLIQFSGTAAQVADAFHTEIHRYRVQGVDHIGNAQDPQIPAAFAGVVGGVVSLNDFRRTSEISSKRSADAQQAAASPVIAADIAQVGDARPASATPEYSSGTTHYLFPADWATIYDLNPLYTAGTNGSGASIAIVGRSNINLSDVASFRSGSGLPANQPSVILVSTNPGLVSGDQDESTLDVEWSGATAPAASVKFVVGASTATTDGVDLSAQYIVNHATANIVSTSYGSCEQYMGAAETAFYNSLWQQAASEGISALVSSGDSGAAGCDGGSSTKGSIAAVNGLCSSPYSTCVGGTEFNEGATPSQYWAATNSSADGSALSYIPEKVWNESASNGGSGLWSSGGGASAVYAQPSWQKGVAGAGLSNGMRAVPDVALSAAGHDGYIIVEDGSYWVIAGTSAASPSFAGVMALVVQSQAGKGQGNANPSLYAMLNASKNPFHATPAGNNTVPGVAGFTASGAAYNLATGLGSVDGALLVSGWSSGTAAAANFALTQSAASGTAVAGKTVTYTIAVTESGSAKYAVALSVKASAGITATISPASITPGTSATVTLVVATTGAAGAQSIVVTGSDSSGTQTLTYALTVTQPPTLSVSPTAASVSAALGSAVSVNLAAATAGSFTGAITWSISGLPTGVTAAWSANPVTPATASSSTAETLTLTASPTAKIASSVLTVTAAGSGLTASSQITLAVTQAPGITLAVSPVSVTMQSLASATVTVTASPVGGLKPAALAAGSTIAIASGLPKGIVAAWSAPSLTASGNVVWTLTLTGSASAAAGSATLGLTTKVAPATGAAVTAGATLPLTVTATPPTLAVTASSSALAVVQSKTVADQVTLTGNASYAGAITLSVSSLPAGVTATWSSGTLTLNGGVGSSTLTLAAASSSSIGPATITITAKGDGVATTKQVTLQVTPAPALQLTLCTASLSMAHTGSASVTVSLTEVGGLDIPTMLTLAGLPPGVTPTLTNVKAGAAGAESGTLTFLGSTAAKAGTVTLTIGVNGVSGGVTYTAQQTLSLQMK